MRKEEENDLSETPSIGWEAKTIWEQPRRLFHHQNSNVPGAAVDSDGCGTIEGFSRACEVRPLPGWVAINDHDV